MRVKCSRGGHVLAAGLLWLAAMPAVAAESPRCQLGKFLELPVTMAGNRPLVAASIAGRPARFILDSGAFYSTMSQASAAEFGLRLDPAPSGFHLRGLNGAASASIATVRDFGLGGVTLPRLDFLVGGTDTGTAGLLGQNLLGLGDVEYDLPHGAIRLFEAKNCQLGQLAYWAGDRPVTMVPLEARRPPWQVHTVGTVTLNGVKLRATFDTGAPLSMLTLAAAKRAGLGPDSPGVVPAGVSTGLGGKAVRAWMGRFDRIDIGGEAIAKPYIRFGAVEIDTDMLIGADFFRTHHIYVANKAGRMLITYEGGPLFGLTPNGAVTSDGAKLDLTDRNAAEPTDAEGYSRRGAVLAANGKADAALADFDRAVAMAPGEPRYLRQRATLRMQNRQPLPALADIDRAITLDPADPEARMMRAAMRFGAGDPAGARDDLHAADRSLPPSADQRLRLGSMLNVADDHERALANFDGWLRFHSEDASRPSGLNGRCWSRALLDRELPQALDDCNAAIRARPGNASFLDSRALVRFRRGELPQALADYDAALRIQPRNAWSLYARGLVRRRLGDADGAAADRAAALAIQPRMAERARTLKLEE